MGVYLRELGIFLWDVINNWAGYATGGIVVAFIGLWSTLSRKTASRRFGIVVALFFLFFAFFNAWRAEYGKTYPTLRLAIDLEGFADTLEDQPGHSLLPGTGTAVMLFVDIRNLGAPSIADHWTLYLTVPGRKGVIEKYRFSRFRPQESSTYSHRAT